MPVYVLAGLMYQLMLGFREEYEVMVARIDALVFPEDEIDSDMVEALGLVVATEEMVEWMSAYAGSMAVRAELMQFSLTNLIASI